MFQLGSALLDACVLAVISKGDTYGYLLTQEIRNIIEVSESTLYPVLRRLQAEQMLATYDRPYNGRNRRYYQITPRGREHLEYLRDNWQHFKAAVDYLLSPATPVASATPASPASPAGPAASATPATPAGSAPTVAPVGPGIPDALEASDIPAPTADAIASAGSDASIIPDATAASTTLDTPDIADTPDTPDTPKTSETSIVLTTSIDPATPASNTEGDES